MERARHSTYKFNPEQPPVVKIEFTCDRSTCGIDASCIAIDKVEAVEQMYLLFTPNLKAAEIGYLLIKDDELQNWCEKCVFRAEKTSTNWLGRRAETDKFEGAAKELEALERAKQAVGFGV